MRPPRRSQLVMVHADVFIILVWLMLTPYELISLCSIGNSFKVRVDGRSSGLYVDNLKALGGDCLERRAGSSAWGGGRDPQLWTADGILSLGRRAGLKTSFPERHAEH